MAIWFGVVASLLIAGASAQCPDDYDLVGARCLKFLTDSIHDHDSAQIACQDFGGRLIEIRDCTEMGAIARHIEENELDPMQYGFWTAGYESEAGIFMWPGGQPVVMGAPFWGRGPDLAPLPQLDNWGDDNCVIMRKTDGYYFQNYGCSYSMVPLCEIEMTDGACPEPYVNIDGKCLQAVTVIETDVEDAQIICETSSGTLARIDECHMMTSVINYLKTLESTSAEYNGLWLGAYRYGSKWQWVDTTEMPMGVPFWGRSGYGDLSPMDDGTSGRCIELWAHDRYYFNAASCDDEFKFPICAPASDTTDSP